MTKNNKDIRNTFENGQKIKERKKEKYWEDWSKMQIMKIFGIKL